MKKISGTIILLIIIFFTYTVPVSAALKLFYDGKNHIYNARPVTLIVNDKKITPKVPPVILNNWTLVPARAVFEEMGAKVSWKESTKQVTVKTSKHNIVLIIDKDSAVVDGKSQKLMIPAKIINQSTMIPLRFVSENIGLKVKWDPDTYFITISDKASDDNSTKDDTNAANPKGQESSNEGTKTNQTASGTVNNISFQTDGDKTQVRIEADAAIPAYSKMEPDKEEAKPFRLVIDIPDKSIDIPQLTIPVEDGRIVKIRSALNQESPKLVRVVLDMVSKLPYSIDCSEDKKALIISVGGNISQDDKANNSQTPENTAGNQKDSELGTENADDYEFFNSKMGENNSIGVKDEEEKICVTINKKRQQNIKVQRVTNPEAIQIEIDKAEFQEESFMIPVSTSPITYFKGEKIDSEKGKLIITTSIQVPYQVIEEPECTNIYIYKEGYKSIRYENSGALSTIVIANADTTKEVVVEQDSKNNQSTVCLPEKLADIKPGIIQVNDKMVEQLEITDEGNDKRNIKVKFAGESKVSYTIRSDSKNNFYVYFFARDKINIPDGDILIAIDPGHGGNDPGTVYKDKNGIVKVKESDLNLDIACRLNRILTDLGIPTIMTRTKDERVELNQRTILANSMKADLFISIHNNWIDSPSVSGTMTFYNPYYQSDRGLTSKRLAEIVQEELLRTIDTIDRKIKNDPVFYVVKTSDMPAVLVECGFVSNESDRNKLTTEQHREKIAQALYTAVIKAIGELEK